ncbi:class I SAM-dependent methyltransferase [Chitinimonas sp.]|uniref:class I SAM-dependent methyltransferase n=1 Tax=Chitinimonas sp. TaxID=1934313 RepID=UPI002F93E1AA
MDQQHLAAQQFGHSAAQYLHSQVHAQGEDLARLSRLSAEQRPGRVLDLGCGAGHASFALAQGDAREIHSYDLAPEMLAVVAAEAQRRGLSQIQTRQGPAEALPYADASFDLIVTRYSAHHWADVEQALRECARVLRPDGRLVVIDVTAPAQPLLDTALQTLELLRDASHVRNYRQAEWQAMLVRAGFVTAEQDCWKISLQFDSWVARIATPAPRIAALREVMAALSREASDYYAIEPDGSFRIDTSWITAVRHPT